MAHTSGGVLLARASSAGNPITANVTTADGDTVIVLLLKIVGATNRAGGEPTFSGTPMVSAGPPQKAAVAPEAGCEVWYLFDPPIGTFQLSIPNTGALTVFRSVVAGRARAGATSRLRGVSVANATAVNPSPGAIECGEGDLVVAITAGGWTAWLPTAQAGTVIANTDDGAHGEGTQFSIRPSAGSFNLGWTFSTADDWGAIAVAFREALILTAPTILRQPGPLQSGADRKLPVGASSFSFVMDIALADLQDPTVAFTLIVERSTDQVNWQFDMGGGVIGHPLNTETPTISSSFPVVTGDVWYRPTLHVTGRAVLLGGTLTIL